MRTWAIGVFTWAILGLLPCASRAVSFGVGTGTPNDPFQIATARQLISIGSDPNLLNKHFVLVANINLDPNLPGNQVFATAVIAPDLNELQSDFQGPAFSGTLDGQSHVIRGLRIAGKDYVGLFGKIEAVAQIRGLGVQDANIVGRAFAGGLTGDSSGTVTHCFYKGWVRGTYGVGGLVGNSEGGTVFDCCSEGSVSGAGHAGGLVGSNTGTVSNSCSTCSVTGGTQHTGGLVGFNTGTVSNSYGTGLVSGNADAGGLVGFNDGGTVLGSFWDTTTSGRTTSAGGTGQTTAELMDIKTFLAAGWDFLGERENGVCEIWQMPAQGGYPVLSTLNGYVPSEPNGAGTVQDPYILATAKDLGTVWYRPGACYSLASDIDLSGIVWSMAVIPQFAGRFYGRGHQVVNMTVFGAGNIGLFGSVASGAVVSDLGLEDVNVVGTGSFVGGVAGANSGTISSSYSKGLVSGVLDVGGLVGFNSGTVSTSCSTVSVSGHGPVGGLVGYNFGTVSNSYSVGAVGGTDGVGGLVGTNSGEVRNCYSIGAVTGKHSVGGLVGLQTSGAVSNSFWDKITSGRTTSAGGVAKTTAEMKNLFTFFFAGWDLFQTWCMPAKDYPRLEWEAKCGG